MTSLQKINELSGGIISSKSKIEGIEYKLSQLSADDSRVDARLTLQINRNRRSCSSEWLTKEEVVIILNRRLQEEKETLAALEKEYNILMQTPPSGELVDLEKIK